VKIQTARRGLKLIGAVLFGASMVVPFYFVIRWFIDFRIPTGLR
jgi:hypothetical protein